MASASVPVLASALATHSGLDLVASAAAVVAAAGAVNHWSFPTCLYGWVFVQPFFIKQQFPLLVLSCLLSFSRIAPANSL
jgi:hypothetical protein